MLRYVTIFFLSWEGCDLTISWLFIFLILLLNWWNVLICLDEIRFSVSWRHLMGPELCRRLKLFPLQISTVLGLYWIGSWSLVILLHFMRWWVDGIGLSIWVIRVGKFVNWNFFFWNFLNWIKFFILYIIFLPIYILDRIFWNILNSFRWPVHFISFPVFFYVCNFG